MRICLLSYRSNPHCGGQGVYIKHLSRELYNLGHGVDVVSGPPLPRLDHGVNLIALNGLDLYNPDDLFRMPDLQELSDPVNLMEWLGVSSMGFPEPFTFGLRAYNYLRRRPHRYDIVHDNQSLSYGIWAISRLMPTTATIHHPITVDRDIAVKSAPTFWGKLQQKRWYSFIGMQVRVARRMRHLITVSQQARDDIGDAFKIQTRKIDVVENGVDTTRFYPLAGVERGKNRVIVTNSADTPLKGLGYLLRAVAKIAAVRPIQLTVVGSPKKNGFVTQMIQRLGIGHLVCFTGRISDEAFVAHYAKATVAVVPSVYEGFGLPAAEAMACAVPVISTRAGALPEVVGEAGVLVPTADASALAQAIADLLDHPERARRLGEAGFKRVREKFSWQQAAQRTVVAYQKVLNAYGRL